MPNGKSTTSGDGIYSAGTGVSVDAIANSGFFFINWTKDGVEVSDESSFTYTMPDSDVTLTAHFAEEEGVQHVLIEDTDLMNYVAGDQGTPGTMKVWRTGSTYFRVKLNVNNTEYSGDIGWCTTLNMPISGGVLYDVILYTADHNIPSDVFGGHYTPGKIDQVWGILEKANSDGVTWYKHIQGAIWKVTDDSYSSYYSSTAEDLYVYGKNNPGTVAGVIAIPVKIADKAMMFSRDIGIPIK